MQQDRTQYRRKDANTPAGQRGAALIFSLLILLVLTVLALSSIRSTTMEELLARNTRDYKIAFESSGSGLSGGIIDITAPGYLPPPSGCTGASDTNELCAGSLDHATMNATDNITAKDQSWWENNANAPTGVTALDLDPGSVGSGNLSSAELKAPLVITDHMLIRDSLVSGFGVPQGKHVYRVTTRGTGLNENTQVVVQQTYFKPF